MAEAGAPLLLVRLRAVHAALAEAGFDHAVGGAIALAVHVREPRFTADIDLNVIADPEHPEALFACLPAALPVHAKAVAEVRRDGQTRLVWPDPATPVDLFLPQHPTYHRLAVGRAAEVDFLGDGIKVLGATDLIVFKVLSNRSKDSVDIESLIENGAGDVDEAVERLNAFLGAEDPRIARLAELRRQVDRRA